MITIITLFILIGIVLGAEVRISSISNFSSFVNDVNNGLNCSGTTVYLDSDLSLSGYTAINPIGTSSSYQFRGVFDGQGYVISNLNISSSYYTGLFGYSEGLIIINVVLDSSCSITNTYSGSGDVYIGGIIGYCYSGYGECNIMKNVNMASVTFSGSISSSSYSLYLGGIAGYLSPYIYPIYVNNCANYGSVTHSGKSTTSYIGGIVDYLVGSAGSYTYIYNCLNYGTITHSGTTSFLYLGGIAGYASYSYIENCVSAGKISLNKKSSYIGSLVGYAYYTYINYCYYTNDVGNYSIYGSGTPVSELNTPNTSSNVNSTLISNLNSQVTTENGWNKWFLNLNNETITFKVNDNIGFSLSSQIILFPIIVVIPPLVFSGWYTDPYYNVSFQSDEVIESMTLYSLYGVAVNVTFNATGGNLTITSKSTSVNSSYGDLPTPNKTGYTFVGWYTETPENDLVTNSTIVSIPNNHTLYAHWKPIQYTISFMSDGESAYPNITQDYDTPITLPVLSKTGYTLVCWCNDTDLKIEYTAKKIEPRNVTLYAQWVANNYTVSFKEECRASLPPVNVTYNSTYSISEPPSAFGFLWWEIVKIGQRVNNESIVEIAQNHALCAVWKVNTVTFNVSGGDDNLAPVNVTYGEKYKNLANATRTGYTFVGWFFNDSSTEPITNDTNVTIPYPHTLYARWKINSYTVTFDPDNGENVDAKIFEYNSTVAYPKEPDKRGYTFFGWDNNITIMPAHNLTITAQWEANNYTVTLDVNGGDDLVINKVKVTFNSTYGDLPVPTREGYSFAEWFNGENEIVTNETIVNKTEDHTLYAQWKEIPTSQVEITFSTKDLSKEDIESVIKQYTNDNFTIVGFEDTSDGIRVIIKFSDPVKAEEFVRIVRSTNDRTTKSLIKRVDFNSKDFSSFSSSLLLYPFLLFAILVF